jgi:hypothetical protein
MSGLRGGQAYFGVAQHEIDQAEKLSYGLRRAINRTKGPERGPKMGTCVTSPALIILYVHQGLQFKVCLREKV